MIPGFVVSSEGPKTLLARVVSPTLAGAPYNVPGTMADPELEIFPAGSNTPILANDNWGDSPDAAFAASTAQAVGAFALATAARMPRSSSRCRLAPTRSSAPAPSPTAPASWWWRTTLHRS